MKASDLFVKCLEAEGVEYIFAVPGEENLHFLESIRTSKIQLIVNRHEQCSAFMAATYGRLTGKVGVCMSTLGPGATNLVTGIAHAQLGGMPLLAITGQKGIRENLQGRFQILDIVNMMKPLTKRSVQLRGPKSIPQEVHEAFKVATAERQGACHIEVPEDIAAEYVDDKFKPFQALKMRRAIADPKAVRLAAEKIKAAKNPVIIVSSRGQRNSVSNSLCTFCDATNIYVIHTQLGKGVLPADHKNCLHSFGIHRSDYVNTVVDNADLIITIGYSTVEYPPAVWNPEFKKDILHIDFTPAETDAYYSPSCEIIGDIATSLDLLARELNGYTYKAEYEEHVRTKLHHFLFEDQVNDPAFPMKPRRIVAECRRVLGREDILSLDNGIYKLWFSRHYPTYHIGTFLLDNSLATMGAGLAAAMSAKLLFPEKRVLAVCGDGGFMMNSQELETAVRLKLNVVVLILNDNGYGFIKWKQQMCGYQNYGLEFGNPDFVKYAEAYGAKGFRVTSADHLLPLLEKAFNEKCPVIVEVPIDYSENAATWSGNTKH